MIGLILCIFLVLSMFTGISLKNKLGGFWPIPMAKTFAVQWLAESYSLPTVVKVLVPVVLVTYHSIHTRYP